MISSDVSTVLQRATSPGVGEWASWCAHRVWHCPLTGDLHSWDMTTTHHFHVRANHVGVTRRPASFIAAGVAAAACALVAISSIGSSGEPAVVDLVVEPAEVDALNVVEPVSALLDGRAFSAAVQAVVSGILSPSILLDGAAFELAVNEAVAFVTNGSALLDGTAFADAVAKAVTAVTD